MSWDGRFAERSPWFAPYLPLARRFEGLHAWPTPADIDERLAADAGVRFVAAVKTHPRRRAARPLQVEELYEVQIVRRGEVPTRPESWHDLLNALVWAAFPRAKLALTRRLAREQEAQARVLGWRLPNRRTRVQDRLALLDEGGVVRGHDGARVFGHAVLEHLLDGRPSWVTCVALEGPSLDRALAAHFDDADTWAPGPREPPVALETLAPPSRDSLYLSAPPED